MKLLIDTSMPKLVLFLIDKNKVIYSKYLNEQKKADALPGLVEECLKENNVSIKDIDCYFVTQGPGSFMGARTALTLVRTIAQVNGSKLFVSNTLEFYGKGNDFYHDAKSNQSFFFDSKTKATKLVPFQENTEIDYKDLEENISSYLSSFKEVKPSEAKPLYIKDPKIGGN